MNWTLLGGIAVATAVLLAFRASFRRGKQSARTAYRKQDFLFSPEERLFYSALKVGAAADYEVFGRIRASDLIEPRSSSHSRASAKELEILSGHRFAFVLCSKTDLSVVCAVRLHEPLFGGKKSPRLPDPLGPLCRAAGLPVVEFEAAAWYDPNELRKAIEQAVSKEPLYVAESHGRKEPRISGLENLDL